MRKLKLQMQVSIDGYVAGPNGEMDWMEWNWDDGLKEFVQQLTEPVDTIVMGKNLAMGFIPHWTAALQQPESNDVFARKMVETPKLVFTKTIGNNPWNHTQLATGDLKEEIGKLKMQEGKKDIITYGGASLAGALIAEQLIDDLYLFVNPTAIGNGMRIFNGQTHLVLQETLPFACGIVVLHYSPKR